MPNDSMKPNRFSSRARMFSFVASIVVFLIGAFVFIGWLFDLVEFKSLYGAITMKANTAVALILAAVSLFYLRDNRGWRLRVGEICAALIAVLGLLTLSEHIFGWNLHIDQLLFEEAPGALATTSPNRMGITASSCFAMFGIALLLLNRRKLIPVAQVLTIVGGLWALLSVIGYAYQAEQLYSIARFTGIAFHTAVALFLLSLGILARCIDDGITSIFCDEGAAGTMARELAIVGLMVPFVLGWLRIAAQRAGYLDLGLGASLVVLSMTIIFLVSIWRAATELKFTERERLIATSALREREQEIERARDYAEATLRTSPVPLLVLEKDLRVVTANEAFYTMFQVEGENTEGRLVYELGNGQWNIPALRKLLEDILPQHSWFKEFEVTHDFEGIGRRTMLLNARRMEVEAGGPERIVLVIEDITARKQALDERDRLLERELKLRLEAEKANRVKDEFLATVSHELRTPLHAMLGWATMLKRTKADQATIQHGIEVIERNAQVQAQLIEDMLDASRIITGKMRLDIKSVTLTPIVKAAMDSVQPAADAKQSAMEILVDPTADRLRADEARLQQVIWNLLSNGIKFTPTGGRIQVKIGRSDSVAEITVRDTGEGISKEFLPLVFDRFKQADASTTRKHGGLGLGLAITRHLVELHGGTIEADSDGPGRGSTFRVRIPLAPIIPPNGSREPRSGTTELQEVSQGAQPPNLLGVKILAIDDVQDTRDMLRYVLAQYGAEVTTAASAFEGLAVMAGWKPDVIVCDIGMPEEDGYSFIKRVRDLEPGQGGKIPAIALTGYVRVEDRMRALEAGYQMFVPKPVEAEELASSIATVCANGGRLQ